MSTHDPFVPYTEAQRREAANWFVIIQAGVEPSTESMQAWLRWMDEHEGNRAAFDAVARAWHGTPPSSALSMPSAEEIAADDYEGNESIAEWLAARELAKQPASSPTSRFARIESRRAWLAAACALFVLALAFTGYRYFDLRDSHIDEFVTRTGEQIEITLADGSRVWLGPKSVLAVTFDESRRAIRLTKGEAFFSVKKDSARPFTVSSPGGDIVAVGTAFNVRTLDEQVTVAVSEGVVAVLPTTQLDAPKPASVRVESGQELTFTALRPIKALTVVASLPGERARWRDGVLVYRNEPLQAVVSDIVRYSDIDIQIADSAVGNFPYSGVIYRDALPEWVSALPESFPVTIVADGERRIIRAR